MGAGHAGAMALLATALLAQDAGAVTLRETLQQTFRENPRIEASRRELEAVREELNEARGGWKPTVGVTGSSVFNDVDTNIRSERFTTSRVGLRLNQNLYEGGATLAAIDSANSRIRSQEGLLDLTEQEVLLQAVAAYSRLLRDQNILDDSNENVSRLEEQLSAVERRFSVGEATRTDLAQGEARLVGSRADQALARANAASSLVTFERVVGFRPDSLQTTPLPDSLPEGLEAALALVEANPEVMVARSRLEEAEAAVDDARATFLPDVDVEAEASYTDEPSIFTEEERDLALGLTVTVPIYQAGIAGARLRQARQLVEQSRRELADTRRRTAETIGIAVEDIRSADARVSFFEDQVEAYQRALAGIKEEALIGSRSVIDVLDAEQDLFNAQVQLERAISDRVTAAYRLEAGIGEMTGSALSLDPAELADSGS